MARVGCLGQTMLQLNALWRIKLNSAFSAAVVVVLLVCSCSLPVFSLAAGVDYKKESSTNTAFRLTPFHLLSQQIFSAPLALSEAAILHGATAKYEEAEQKLQESRSTSLLEWPIKNEASRNFFLAPVASFASSESPEGPKDASKTRHGLRMKQLEDVDAGNEDWEWDSDPAWQEEEEEEQEAGQQQKQQGQQATDATQVRNGIIGAFDSHLEANAPQTAELTNVRNAGGAAGSGPTQQRQRQEEEDEEEVEWPDEPQQLLPGNSPQEAQQQQQERQRANAGQRRRPAPPVHPMGSERPLGPLQSQRGSAPPEAPANTQGAAHQPPSSVTGRWDFEPGQHAHGQSQQQQQQQRQQQQQQQQREQGDSGGDIRKRRRQILNAALLAAQAAANAFLDNTAEAPAWGPEASGGLEEAEPIDLRHINQQVENIVSDFLSPRSAASPNTGSSRNNRGNGTPRRTVRYQQLQDEQEQHSSELLQQDADEMQQLDGQEASLKPSEGPIDYRRAALDGLQTRKRGH